MKERDYYRAVLEDLYWNTGDDADCECFFCHTIRDALWPSGNVPPGPPPASSSSPGKGSA